MEKEYNCILSIHGRIPLAFNIPKREGSFSDAELGEDILKGSSGKVPTTDAADGQGGPLEFLGPKLERSMSLRQVLQSVEAMEGLFDLLLMTKGGQHDFLGPGRLGQGSLQAGLYFWETFPGQAGNNTRIPSFDRGKRALRQILFVKKDQNSLS
jgi:hypothetical protein